MSLSTFLFGHPLANREAELRKIKVFEGLPTMGLDGLGSAVCGPEVALTVLAPLGVAGLAAIGPVNWVILVLLAVLFFSYWQTVTDRLIPLFAVGAFLAFTLSQAGMAVHWLRQGGGGAKRWRLAVNGVGALATGAALAIILVAKFTEGAWLTIVVIPATLYLLRLVHRYYAAFDRQPACGGLQSLALQDRTPPLVVIPVASGTRSAAAGSTSPSACRPM